MSTYKLQPAESKIYIDDPEPGFPPDDGEPDFDEPNEPVEEPEDEEDIIDDEDDEPDDEDKAPSVVRHTDRRLFRAA